MAASLLMKHEGLTADDAKAVVRGSGRDKYLHALKQIEFLQKLHFLEGDKSIPFNEKEPKPTTLNEDNKAYTDPPDYGDAEDSDDSEENNGAEKKDKLK